MGDMLNLKFLKVIESKFRFMAPISPTRARSKCTLGLATYSDSMYIPDTKTISTSSLQGRRREKGFLTGIFLILYNV